MKLKMKYLLLIAVMLSGWNVVVAQQPQNQESAAEAAARKEAELAKIPRITVEELKSKLSKNEAVFILDVRMPDDYDNAKKKIKGSVRISPYDSQARRHTSFASVFVYPDVDDTIEIDLREEDIKMDVFRASGAGGQHVNKTSSAVRLTHLPTGVVVSCQQERSQTKNRATAMKMLRAALYQRKLEEQEVARAAIEATKTDNSWGNQIRSYVFQPYTMVNDHRTELKVGDVQRVMDGDLDAFIEAYLKRFGGKAA